MAKVQLSKVTDSENVKKAGTAVTDGTKAAVQKINEAVNSPKVQDAVSKARITAAGAFSSAFEGVKKLINKNEEEPAAEETEDKAE